VEAQTNAQTGDGRTSQKSNFLGHVISVRGSQADVGFPAPSPQHPEEARATVGKFLGIISGRTLLIGIITNISSSPEHGQPGMPMATAKLDRAIAESW
jgi:hypothetical protein